MNCFLHTRLLLVTVLLLIGSLLPGCGSTDPVKKTLDSALEARGGTAETDKVDIKPQVASSSLGDAIVEGDLGWTRENLANGAGWVLAFNLAGESGSSPDSVERALTSLADQARNLWAEDPSPERLATAKAALEELRAYRRERREEASGLPPQYPMLREVTNVMVVTSGVGTQNDPVSADTVEKAAALAKAARELRGRNSGGAEADTE